MEVVRDVSSCPPPETGSVVTIGAYDGVHLGHQVVIRQVLERARAGGHTSAVVTFDRHPAAVVRPESAPRLLTDLAQKLELLERTGLERCLVVAFDEVRSKEPAEEFVQEVLVGCLAAKVVIVGEDFHFGHQRRGNVALLREMGASLGFEVEGLELVNASGRAAGPGAGEKVSSTAIRRALLAGDMVAASSMLGRRHEVRGRVERAGAAGRSPSGSTLDVSVPGEILLPADGTYSGELEPADGPGIEARLSVGQRPPASVEAHAHVVEAELPGVEVDLSGQLVKVRFVERAGHAQPSSPDRPQSTA